jgi:hypothetical protein
MRKCCVFLSFSLRLVSAETTVTYWFIDKREGLR